MRRAVPLGQGGGHLVWRATLGLLAGGLALVAQAGDCWVDEARSLAPGDASVRGAQMARAARLLRQAPVIQAIDGVRYQLRRHASPARHAGAPGSAEVAVWLHTPKAWAAGCSLMPWAGRVYPAGLSVHFNDLGPVWADAAPPEGGLRAMRAPRETGRVAGHPIYDGRLLVITPPGVPAWVPVTTGQWLDAWQRHLQAESRSSSQELAELSGADWSAAEAQLARLDPAAAASLRQSLQEARQMARQPDATGERAALQALRASLDAAALAAPAWISSEALEGRRFALASPRAPGAQALVQVNPVLWRGAGPGAIRVVALEVFLNRTDPFDSPDSPLEAAARSWLSQVDPHPYAELLTP